MPTAAGVRPLEGKCALVTGSVRGLGLATARRLAAAGSHIVMNGFDAAGEAGALQHEIEAAHGVRTLYSPADLRDPVEIAQLVAGAAGTFGAVDILVNNAVVRHTAPVEQFRPEDWDEALAVNVSAAFHTIRLALPGMKDRRWGRIINVSSIYGVRGAPNRVAYVTSKTALIGLTRAVAMETVAHGITCNAVCPGTTESPVHAAAIADLARAHGISHEEAEDTFLRGKQPSGRFIPADAVAALILFLCGREADSITGAVLPIDDGWSSG